MKKRIIVTVMALVLVSSLSGCGSNASGSGTAKADENGNYVVNGSFENADFTPWVVTNIDDGLFEYTGIASSQLSLKYRDSYFKDTEWFFDAECKNKINVFPFKVSPNKVEITMGSRTTGVLEQGNPSHLSQDGNVYTLSDLSRSVGSTLSPTEATRGKHFHIESIKYFYNC